MKLPFFYSLIALGITLLKLDASPSSIAKLSEGGQLSGELLELSPDGSTTIKLANSQQIATIKSDALISLEFPQKGLLSNQPKERVIFTNGDELACDLISLDRSSVTFSTWFADPFTIPLQSLKSIHFDNIAPPEIKSDTQWVSSSNWMQSEGNLTSKGYGEISRVYPLPSNFSLKFNAKWTSRNTRFRIYFCGKSRKLHPLLSCYYIDFSSYRTQVYRIATNQSKLHMGKLDFTLNKLEKSSVDIQIDVDRKNQQVAISIDGKEAFVFEDPEFSPPSGSILTFSSQTPNSGSLTISNIRLQELDHSLFNKEIVPKETETLIDNEGLSFNGTLLKLLKQGKQRALIFQRESTPHLTVPLERASALHFPQHVDTPSESKSPLHLTLRRDGHLSLTNLAFSKGKAEATHPILGSFLMKKNALQSLSRKTISK